MGDDKVIVLRRCGQGGLYPDKGSASQRQPRDPGNLKGVLPVAHGDAGHARGMGFIVRSMGAIWHQGLQARPVLLATNVGRITLVTSAPKVQVENP